MVPGRKEQNEPHFVILIKCHQISLTMAVGWCVVDGNLRGNQCLLEAMV
jgi:hypothetical protein